jgi:shikimate dehydrogenase
MRKYGIIGKPLEHSYSAQYFTEKFTREHIDAEYQAYEINDLTRINALMQELHGFNVTHPYKEEIITHLHDIDPVAKAIGAVNVVHQCKGYNTDWIGFMQSITPHLTENDKNVLVLGTGGVSKAVQYALQQMGLHFTLVSRTPTNKSIGYNNITQEIIEQHSVIVNCTPLGMLPNIASIPPIPYQHLTHAHLLYDCVYNPACTAFLNEGQKRGTRIVNGMQMLLMQANAAWEIWSMV